MAPAIGVELLDMALSPILAEPSVSRHFARVFDHWAVPSAEIPIAEAYELRNRIHLTAPV
jgi:hypothetical protein